MTLWLLFGVCIASALLIFWYPGWRRRRVLAVPLPQDWRALLEQHLPVYPWLSLPEREQLGELLRIFLAEKQFHGCAGLEVTQPMRVVIAAQACLLLLNRRSDVYPALRHILLYPGAFLHRGQHYNPDGTVTEVEEERLGESWQEGKVILSWEDIVYDLENPDDGHNVVLHEFAHQLDAENGSENGMPPLRQADAAAWAAVMTREYEALQRAADHGQESFFDPYGATAPAEFFAVLTETFFELPHDLEHFHPELFAQLQRYYHSDPRRWYPPAA